MKNDYLGVAVVGAGRIGTLRAKLAAKHPSVRYVAISDADPARAKALADQSGANFHSGSNDEIIANPEVNAVIVSTPEGEHAAPVCKALELGKPVLVEKPIAMSLEGRRHDPRDARRRPAATCASATADATRSASCAPRSR